MVGAHIAIHATCHTRGLSRLVLCTVVEAYICVVDVNHIVCRLLLVESRSGCVLGRSVCQRLFLAHRHCCEGSLSLITRRSPRAALYVDRRQFTAAAIRYRHYVSSVADGRQQKSVVVYCRALPDMTNFSQTKKLNAIR